MKKPTTYTSIIKAIEKDGICTSGLDEWNAPRNMRNWRNTKGKKLVDQWFKTTTEEQRFQQFKDFCEPRVTVTKKNFEIVKGNWLEIRNKP